MIFVTLYDSSLNTYWRCFRGNLVYIICGQISSLWKTVQSTHMEQILSPII